MEKKCNMRCRYATTPTNRCICKCEGEGHGAGWRELREKKQEEVRERECELGGDPNACEECAYGVDYKYNPETRECIKRR